MIPWNRFLPWIFITTQNLWYDWRGLCWNLDGIISLGSTLGCYRYENRASIFDAYMSTLLPAFYFIQDYCSSKQLVECEQTNLNWLTVQVCTLAGFWMRNQISWQLLRLIIENRIERGIGWQCWARTGLIWVTETPSPGSSVKLAQQRAIVGRGGGSRNPVGWVHRQKRWQASLFCGAAIISNQWLLSARLKWLAANPFTQSRVPPAIQHASWIWSCSDVHRVNIIA